MSDSKPTPLWLKRSERGSQFMMQLMTSFATLIGRRTARLLLYPIAAWFWLRTPQARRDSQNYLRRALDRPVRPIDSFNHYLCFSSTILDRIYLLRGESERFEIEVEGREILYKHLHSKAGVFMVGGHLGSFESMKVMAKKQPDYNISMAMFEKNAQRIGRMLRAIDPELTDMIVPLGHIDSMLKIQARLDRGDMVGFLADRSFGNDPVEVVDFLGEPAAFPTGIFRMAAALRRPVLGMTGLYRGGNRYSLHFVELADFTNVSRADRRATISQTVRNFAAMLEGHCRTAPLNWFNFFDFWASAAQASELDKKPSENDARPGSAATSKAPEI